MPRRRVALIVEASRSYGRGLLHGLAEYARINDGWTVSLDDRGLGDQVPRWLRTWHGDGIIARLESEPLVEAVRQLGLPVVDLRGLYRSADMPLVETDETRVVRLAFDHLAEQGVRQFAFCGFEGTNYSDIRCQLFSELSAEDGGCIVYHPPTRPRRGLTVELERANMEFETHLADWLVSLPKPVGVMACNDIRGQQVLQACRLTGLRVPDEVAVVGVDNDELLCELCTPALSSVVPDTRRIGLEAGALLDKLMAGRVHSPAPVFVPPLGVIGRRSTDLVPGADPEVIAAVRFIREHAQDGMEVSDVLAQVRCSRSTLERGFARHIGRSPKAEINRVRVERIQQLLNETNYPLARIAEMTGFEHPEYLSVFFLRETGQTPGIYRDRSK